MERLKAISIENQPREIEIKAQVDDVGPVLQQLEALGCEFSEPVRQRDAIFLPQDVTYDKIVPGTPVLRIREEKGEATFTMKKRRVQELDKLEIETQIENPEALHTILEHLGFRQVLQINKTRRKTTYNDFEVCLDEVEHLGTFVEIEKITNENTRQVQTAMKSLLHKLHVSPNNLVEKGYDTLLYSKQTASL